MKPEILYHASANSHIKVLQPSEEGKRFPTEQPYVFATPDRRMAAMFLAPKAAGSTEICQFGDDMMLAVQSTPEHFRAVDKGGAIYHVRSDTFNTDKSVGMGEIEYFSAEGVQPVQVERFATSIDAIKESGVHLYFVDAETMQAIQAAEDHGLAIFRSQEPYIFSS